MKDASDEEIRKVYEEIKPMCAEKEAFIVINDRLHLAKELKLRSAFGQDRHASPKARLELGPSAIIGVTANTFDDILAVRGLDIDYIGIGPFEFTETKKNLAPKLGIEGIKELCRRMDDNGIEIARVAVGGIKSAMTSKLPIEAGVNGLP